MRLRSSSSGSVVCVDDIVFDWKPPDVETGMNWAGDAMIWSCDFGHILGFKGRLKLLMFLEVR